MNAAFIFTGNNGTRNATSSNIGHMVRELNLLGYAVDINYLNINNPAKFSEEIKKFVELYDLCIVIGGLATTFNPNAKEIIANTFSMNLLPHQESVQKLQQIYSRKGQTPTQQDIRYITIPAGSLPLADENYAIPGFAVKLGNKTLIVIPANDDAYIDIYVKKVFPFIASLNNTPLVSKLINIFGLSTMQAQNILNNEIMAKEALVSVYGKSSGAKYVQISTINTGQNPAQAGVIKLNDVIKNKLGSLISAEDIQMLPANIVRLLSEYELKISIAESITNGTVDKSIRSITGGDNIIETSINTFVSDVKNKEMNVPKDILKNFPEASEHMAMCMAAGILENGEADIAISVSGGMISDNRGSYNSTGFISLATEQGITFKKIDLIGLFMSETQIISILTISILEMLYVFLKDLPNSVKNLFELKTLRQKDLDKTIEGIRRREDILSQDEKGEIAIASQQLIQFSGAYPPRNPPIIPTSPQTNLLSNPPPLHSEPNNPPVENDGAVPMDTGDDDAIPIDKVFPSDYNEFFNETHQNVPDNSDNIINSQHIQDDNFTENNKNTKDGAIPMGNNFNQEQDQFGQNSNQKNPWDEKQNQNNQSSAQEQFGQGQQQNPYGQGQQSNQYANVQQDQGQQSGQQPYGQNGPWQQQNQFGQNQQSGQNQQGQQPYGQNDPWQQQNQFGQQADQSQFGQQSNQSQQRQQTSGQNDPWQQQNQFGQQSDQSQQGQQTSGQNQFGQQTGQPSEQTQFNQGQQAGQNQYSQYGQQVAGQNDPWPQQNQFGQQTGQPSEQTQFNQGQQTDGQNQYGQQSAGQNNLWQQQNQFGQQAGQGSYGLGQQAGGQNLFGNQRQPEQFLPSQQAPLDNSKKKK